MYFLFDTCQHPDILRVLYFIYLLLDIVFVVVPIGLVIMLMVDFTKAVIAGEEKEQIKNTKLVVKRIIYAVLIFVIPWVVNVLMIFIDEVGLDIGGDYRTCITNVQDIRNDTKTFEYFESLLEISEEVEHQKNQNSGNNGNSSGSSGGNVSGDSVYEEAASNLINLAKGELGKTDGTKYGGGVGDSWCAFFTTWALKNTKMSDGTTLYNYINKDGFAAGNGEASGLWPAFVKSSHLDFHKSSSYGGSYTPKKGDIVWFRWNTGYCKKNGYDDANANHRCADHVGIVVSYDGTNVHTIEGNSNGQVFAHNDRKMSDIVAFGSWYD